MKLAKIILSDGTLIQDGQVEYIIAKNGIFKRIENDVISGLIKVDSLPEIPEVDPKVVIKIPVKIPHSIYAKVFQFFTQYETEVYAQIFWNKDKKEYFVYIPKQVVSNASVRYKRNTDLERKYKLICEIHSHNTMNAFFSTTDDTDEQTGIIYGVMSTKSIYESKFRIKMYDTKYTLELTDIFDIPEIPKEWAKNVKKLVNSISKYHNYGGSIYNNQDNDMWNGNGYPNTLQSEFKKDGD